MLQSLCLHIEPYLLPSPLPIGSTLATEWRDVLKGQILHLHFVVSMKVRFGCRPGLTFWWPTCSPTLQRPQYSALMTINHCGLATDIWFIIFKTIVDILCYITKNEKPIVFLIEDSGTKFKMWSQYSGWHCCLIGRRSLLWAWGLSLWCLCRFSHRTPFPSYIIQKHGKLPSYPGLPCKRDLVSMGFACFN